MAGHMERYSKYLELNQSLKSSSSSNNNCDVGDDDKQLEKLDELLTFGRKRSTNKRPAKFTDYLYCGSKADANDLDLLNDLRITHVVNCAPRSPWKGTRTFETPAGKDSTAIRPEANIGSNGSSSCNSRTNNNNNNNNNDNNNNSNDNNNNNNNNNPYSQLQCGVVSYLEIDALDNEYFPILRGPYARFKKFVDDARRKAGAEERKEEEEQEEEAGAEGGKEGRGGGKGGVAKVRILVHCELGMNRSVCLCTAYALDAHGTGLLAVVSGAMTDRPNILTNQGFRKQLVQFARERNLAD